MISKNKVYRRVFTGWVHTFVALFVMGVSLLLLLLVTIRFGGGVVVVPVISSTILTSVVMFFLSEWVVVIFLRGERVEENKAYPEFRRCIDELCEKERIRFRPRLYILKGFDKPNAAAFGMSILGQCGIGITDSIYKLLSRDELKSVLAHELGHVRSRDVGLMSVVMIITASAEKISKKLTEGKIFRGPAAILLGWIIYGLSKMIFPVGRAAISQQREFTADALAALYVGTSDHLISALKKLDNEREKSIEEKTVFDDLMISHPRMEFRINQLMKY